MPPPRTGTIGDDIAGLVLTSAQLPTSATPARLAVTRPVRGRVETCSATPAPRRAQHGAWVEVTVHGQVENRHLQLDSTLRSALRIQPGFSGSPVYNRGTSRIVGLLNATPPAASGERDS